MTEQEQNDWDKQIEEDAKAGRLDHLIDESSNVPMESFLNARAEQTNDLETRCPLCGAYLRLLEIDAHVRQAHNHRIISVEINIETEEIDPADG